LTGSGNNENATMARADGNHELEELYRVLMEAQFDYMPHGEIHLKRVYKVVNERHSELCDDSYLCSTSCKDGTNSAEWKHVVRAVLKNLQSRGGPVLKGSSHGFWLFGNQDSSPSVSENDVIEGRRLLKLHKVKERKPQIVRRQKKWYSTQRVVFCAKRAISISQQSTVRLERDLPSVITGLRWRILMGKLRHALKIWQSSVQIATGFYTEVGQ
jgi:hypothetical protein